MRKLESIYNAMGWDTDEYNKIAKLASKNTKDSRVFRVFQGEETKTTLKRVFNIKESIFDEKFRQACSGSGREERRISTLHSSSLCALLFFYNVTEAHPLKLEVSGLGEVTFFDAIFEYQNSVIEDENPSNIDVTLLGKCKDKNVILFLESKFSEYITGVQKCLNIKRVYLQEEISKPLYDKWQWNKMDEFNKNEFSISVSKYSAYLGGLKQMISHYVGVRKFERGIERLKKGKNPEKDLHNVANNAYKQATQKRVREFALEGDVVIILSSILFDVYKNDDTHTELHQYELLYTKLMEQMAEDVKNSASNVQILTRYYTYQELFQNKREWLTKEIYNFYFKE